MLSADNTIVVTVGELVPSFFLDVESCDSMVVVTVGKQQHWKCPLAKHCFYLYCLAPRDTWRLKMETQNHETGHIHTHTHTPHTHNRHTHTHTQHIHTHSNMLAHIHTHTHFCERQVHFAAHTFIRFTEKYVRFIIFTRSLHKIQNRNPVKLVPLLVMTIWRFYCCSDGCGFIKQK